ncbi:MAG: deoxyribodipyrimidine photo-lyase [Bacteroidetes bacterium]|nr:deoxyribodipyrimidine photo-lyase [Bacteroidota bacterium]
MKYNRTLCWIRRDLRLRDHTALAAACSASREVAVAFVFDTTILEGLADRDDRRVTFIHRSLAELDAELRKRGSMLIVRRGDPRSEIPALAAELNAEAVFANHDYEPDALHRDAAVAASLAAAGRTLHTWKDQVVFEKTEIATDAGTAFRVFTPYMRAWLARLESAEAEMLRDRAPDLASLAPAHLLEGACHRWELTDIGFSPAALWLEPGERAAWRRLDAFMERIPAYGEMRDLPSVDGTSGLSAHLRFGTISIRELVRRARAAAAGEAGSGGSGAGKWLSELIWREFYGMILACFPHVVNRAFKPEFDALEWPGRDDHFEAWCAGCTGYPIVDAAMRLLRETGWMHNRLRMVAASFLTKDLLVNYRRGEAWFARHLLDFELASNNGGWQWCASTGCDAQPWFRIFNPLLQSEKFDPEGAFIRRHLPELRGFSAKKVHWPAGADLFDQQSAGCIIGEDYPAPIVDHGTQRERALRMYKAVK